MRETTHTDSPTQSCEHQWQFGGVRYHDSKYPRMGSGEHDRCYTDWFYCTRCLAEDYRNERIVGTNYHKPIDGAMPR